MSGEGRWRQYSGGEGEQERGSNQSKPNELSSLDGVVPAVSPFVRLLLSPVLAVGGH